MLQLNKAKFLIRFVIFDVSNFQIVQHLYCKNVYRILFIIFYFDAGFDIDTPDDFGRTCLHAAAAGGLVQDS